MKTLLILDYTAEVLHLCYILLTMLFRLTVRAAVFCYVSGETLGKAYGQTPVYAFDFSRVDASLQVYLGGTRQLSHPVMIRS